MGAPKSFRHCLPLSCPVHLLGLGRVISNERLCGLGGTGGVLTGERLDLLGLGVDNVRGIGKVVIDELLVRLVDERSEEENRGRNERKTPQWDELDQEVRQEGTQESLEHIR